MRQIVLFGIVLLIIICCLILHIFAKKWKKIKAENKKIKLSQIVTNKKIIIFLLLVFCMFGFSINKVFIEPYSKPFITTGEESNTIFLQVILPAKKINNKDIFITIGYGHGKENIDDSPFGDMECFVQINVINTNFTKELVCEKDVGKFFKDEKSYVKTKVYSFLGIIPLGRKFDKFQLSFEEIIDFKGFEINSGILEFKLINKTTEDFYTLVDVRIGFEIKGNRIIFTN